MNSGGVVPQWTIGDRLRKARELTGLNQTPFAAQIDISTGTVQNYELAKVEPRRIVLKQWALRSGVSLKWLETGFDEESPSGSDPGGQVSPSDDGPDRHGNLYKRDVARVYAFPEQEKTMEVAA